MRAGWSLDMTEECPVTGRKWDFRRPGDRRQAKNLVLKGKPEMLILSPPCTLFSSLQRWSRYGPPEVRRPDDWEEAVGFVDFCVDLCEVQNRGGRGFCFEHPRYASSWELPSMARRGRGTVSEGDTSVDKCRVDARLDVSHMPRRAPARSARERQIEGRSDLPTEVLQCHSGGDGHGCER